MSEKRFELDEECQQLWSEAKPTSQLVTAKKKGEERR
jgi:hypothetical protein